MKHEHCIGSDKTTDFGWQGLPTFLGMRPDDPLLKGSGFWPWQQSPEQEAWSNIKRLCHPNSGLYIIDKAVQLQSVGLETLPAHRLVPVVAK